LLRVLTALYCDTWLIEPGAHRVIADIAQEHAAGMEREAAQHRAAAAMPANPAAREYAVKDGVAVIPVEGVIGRKFSSMLHDSGVTSVDVLDRLIQQAAQDQSAPAIILAFDSPGGTVAGITECARCIQDARAIKPVLAYADGRMLSAAYWLAAQADAIYATPSASVGSIGAYAAILDRTRMAEMQGIKVDVIKSGKHKGMGVPGTALNDEQRAMLQSEVDAIGEQFRATVRAGRKPRAIADETMQGQSFSVAAALANGLIDGEATFAQAIRDALKLAPSVGAAADGSIDDQLADIEAQTDDIGAAGAGLTAIPWNADWDAEVESEVDDALGSGTGAALTAIPWNASWDAEVQSECSDALVAHTPTITVVSPVAADGSATVVIGDDYSNTDGLALSWSITNPGSVDLTSATVTLVAQGAVASDGSDFSKACTVTTATGATLAFRCEPTAANTATLDEGGWPMQIEAVLATSSRVVTLVEGMLYARRDVA